MSPEQSFDRRTFLKKAAKTIGVTTAVAALPTAMYYDAQEQRAKIDALDAAPQASSPQTEDARAFDRQNLENDVMDQEFLASVTLATELVVLAAAGTVYWHRKDSGEANLSSTPEGNPSSV